MCLRKFVTCLLFFDEFQQNMQEACDTSKTAARRDSVIRFSDEDRIPVYSCEHLINVCNFIIAKNSIHVF